MRGAAVKSLSAYSAAVFLQVRAIDKKSLAKLFIHGSSPALLLPSGVRSTDPGLVPEACPNPDLNQTDCNTLLEEAAKTTTLPVSGAYQQLLNLYVTSTTYNLFLYFFERLQLGSANIITFCVHMWRYNCAASLDFF